MGGGERSQEGGLCLATGGIRKKTPSDRNDCPTSHPLWVEQLVVQGFLLPLVQNISSFVIWL